MNHDCHGDEFERHGKRWGRCFMDSTIFEMPPTRPETCPNCKRPWEGAPATEQQWDPDTSEEVAMQLDLPYLRAEVARLTSERDGLATENAALRMELEAAQRAVLAECKKRNEAVAALQRAREGSR